MFFSVLRHANLTGKDIDNLASFIQPKYDDWGINHVVQCLTYSPPGLLPVGLNNDVSCFKIVVLTGRVRKFFTVTSG